MKIIRSVVLASWLTVGVGPAFYLTGCEDRDVSTEIKVDQDRNPDGTVDTTIKRETKID